MAYNTLLLKPLIFTAVKPLELSFVFSEDKDKLECDHVQTLDFISVDVYELPCLFTWSEQLEGTDSSSICFCCSLASSCIHEIDLHCVCGDGALQMGLILARVM